MSSISENMQHPDVGAMFPPHFFLYLLLGNCFVVQFDYQTFCVIIILLETRNKGQQNSHNYN